MNSKEVYEYLLAGNNLSIEDRLKFNVTSIEDLINELSEQYQALFHATRVRIPFGIELNLNPLHQEHYMVKHHIISAGRPTAFAANYARALLIKALFSNKNNLKYSYGEINELGLYGVEQGVVFEQGYIYLLSKTEHFIDTDYSPWEKYTTQNGALFGGAILVTLNDLPSTLRIFNKGNPITIEELRSAAQGE
ncbi:hypothetical protein [Paenibacillus sp. sgz500958]|uniref:hypothetical protein n=1 Tax=Paenibacillus sp. sgz500958 TaxID=3242475 RepID=UPI0036D3A84E